VLFYLRQDFTCRIDEFELVMSHTYREWKELCEATQISYSR